MQKHNFINDEIQLDFKVPESLDWLVNQCKECDANNDWGYFGWADALDDACKELYRQGEMSKKQWDSIIEKYYPQ